MNENPLKMLVGSFFSINKENSTSEVGVLKERDGKYFLFVGGDTEYEVNSKEELTPYIEF